MNQNSWLSQYIVYGQAYPIRSLTFDCLPKHKAGQFSKSPKVWFPSLKFFGLEIFKAHSEAVENP
jgi:hypothetical protein